MTVRNLETALRNKLTQDIRVLNQMIESTVEERDLLMLHGCIVEAEKIWRTFFPEEPPSTYAQSQQAAILN